MLIAGISGAGKSSALDVLADLGFFKIDNLPVALFANFIELSQRFSAKFTRTALLLDIDSREKLEQLMTILRAFQPLPSNIQLLFFDAKTETIVRRYSETRRPHPGFDAVRDKSLEDTVQRERNRLLPFKEIANFVVDTSELNIHQMRKEVISFVESRSKSSTRVVRVNFVSFGFKYGIPIDCDLLVDMRFLPNPHFVDELRDKTGIDPSVVEYVLKSEKTQEFLKRYSELLSFLLPQYVHEGKAYLNIGVGCTGGQHRSVVVAEELRKRIPPGAYLVSVKHRDIGK